MLWFLVVVSFVFDFFFCQYFSFIFLLRNLFFFSFFVLLHYGLFVENTCYKTEGEWKEGHILLLSHSFRGRASIRRPFLDFKKQSVVGPMLIF